MRLPQIPRYLIAVAVGLASGLLIGSASPEPETVLTTHVVMQPGQRWEKVYRLSEVADSIEVIVVRVAVDDSAPTQRL